MGLYTKRSSLLGRQNILVLNLLIKDFKNCIVTSSSLLMSFHPQKAHRPLGGFLRVRTEQAQFTIPTETVRVAQAAFPGMKYLYKNARGTRNNL